MFIERIRLKNFKSFRDIDIKLSDLNIIIGPNASGKSNFISVFKFIHDIIFYDLDNAVSMQGGIEYLRNIMIENSNEIFLEFVLDIGKPNHIFKFHNDMDNTLIVKGKKLSFSLWIGINQSFHDFYIKKEKFIVRFLVDRLEKRDNLELEYNVEDNGVVFEVIFDRNDKGELKKTEHFYAGNNLKEPPEFIKEITRFIFIYSPLHNDEFTPFKLDQKQSILRLIPFLSPPLDYLRDLQIYDFDPRLPKRAVSIAGKIELEHDGSNLSVVLKHLLQNKQTQEQLIMLLNDIVPFIKNINITSLIDRSIIFSLKEEYTKENYLPGSFISDGTINLICIIIALFFEKNRIIVIEEPEKNIHPNLIQKLVYYFKEASERKQLIITTHNPELIKYIDLNSIISITRDNEGFSVVKKVADNKELKIFLENELGVEDLFIQNML